MQQIISPCLLRTRVHFAFETCDQRAPTGLRQQKNMEIECAEQKEKCLPESIMLQVFF